MRAALGASRWTRAARPRGSRRRAVARRVARARARLRDGEGDDDDEGDDAGARHGPVPARVSVPLSNLYDRAVRRALADPFVPYENVAGIINLAECASGDGWRATGLEDAPDLSPSALVDATLAELRDLFGASGVVAEAALTFALADGAAAAATDPAARDDPGGCLLYTSPSPRDATLPRMPSSA